MSGYWGTIKINGETVPWWHESFVQIHVPESVGFVGPHGCYDVGAGFAFGLDGDVDYPIPAPLDEPVRQFRACVAEAGYPSRIWHVSLPVSGHIVAVCLTWDDPMPAEYGERANRICWGDVVSEREYVAYATKFRDDGAWCEATLFKQHRGSQEPVDWSDC
jgi:hypothetical protein